MSSHFNRLKLVLFMTACLGSFALGQSESVNWIGPPVVGLMANAQNTELRAIRGVPGGSTVGDPLGLPPFVRRAYLAPSQPWALVQVRGGIVGRISLNGTLPGSVIPVDGAMSAPGLVSFSSNGQTAALVSGDGGTLQILTHLEATPRISMQADISKLDTAAVTASNDGAMPVILTRTGEVYLVPSSGSPRLIFRTGSTAGFSFLPDQSLAIADGAAGMVTVIDGLTSQPFTRMAIPVPYLSGDGAFVQASSDGKSLIVAAYKGQTVHRIDLVDQSVRSLDVRASVSMLERLNGDIFLFSANPGEAAWLLMADDVNLRAGFAQFTGKQVVNAPSPKRPGPAR